MKDNNYLLWESYYRRNKKPNQLLSFLLAEAYYRNQENVNWFEVFKKIQKAKTGQLSLEDLKIFLNKKKIGIKVIKKDNEIGGYFDLNSRKVIILISRNLYDQIFNAEDEWLENLAANFWVNFVHEDTHRQQQNAAGNFNIFKKYKSPTNLDWGNITDKDIDYFDQQIEADAYGREIGARLEKIYSEDSSSVILMNINSNTIKDEYCEKIINIYKDPRVSKKSNESFFRALYDYLTGYEL